MKPVQLDIEGRLGGDWSSADINRILVNLEEGYMSEHKVSLNWKRSSEGFSYDSYNREHSWTFDNGQTVEASATPAYKGKPSFIDPEEAFVASLTSCHMLTFLALACMKKFVVESYVDEAVGYLEKNAGGKLAITRLVLRPKIIFSGDKQPTAEELAALHDKAHHECFIANSVTTQISVEPG